MTRARGIRSPIRPGVIIRDALLPGGAMAITDMHRLYRDQVQQHNQTVPRTAWRRPMSYHSFLRYVYVLKRLGLIQWAGEEPMELFPGPTNPLLSIRIGRQNPRVVTSTRVLYEITQEGIADTDSWLNPYRSFSEAVRLAREVTEVLTRKE